MHHKRRIFFEYTQSIFLYFEHLWIIHNEFGRSINSPDLANRNWNLAEIAAHKRSLLAILII